ncbi:MAG TPA: HAMP domain-containing sensor histidine kinase [Gemmataceae bacterium]|nr:HAMP domain-containing sensor histidine kinase [Gemmataceae bacterium]
MTQVRPRVLLDYVAALVAVALALALTLQLPPLQTSPSPLFFGAVMVSAWYGGLGPGLFATVLSALALDYYYLTPIHSLSMGLAESIRCLAFVSTAAVISSLNAARHRLEDVLRQRDRRKDEFLALLAHELRAPMDVIANALETCRRRSADQTVQEGLLRNARRQVETVNRLISELGDVAAVGKGKLRLFKTSVELTTIVSQAVETAASLIEEKDHHLTVELPPEPLQLEADALRLEQILVELLAHAARYTPKGGQIQLGAERAGSDIIVRVRDNGLGFSADTRPHVFDLFVRDGDGSAELGVGLHLVRRLVELHGGKATARSPGLHKGSEYLIRLPIGAGRPEEKTPESGRPSEVVGPAAAVRVGAAESAAT